MNCLIDIVSDIKFMIEMAFFHPGKIQRVALQAKLRSNIFYFLVLFPFLETLLANLGVSMFKRKDIDYYNRLIDRIIENKKAAKGEAVSVVLSLTLNRRYVNC